jgi:hypothetical protein
MELIDDEQTLPPPVRPPPSPGQAETPAPLESAGSHGVEAVQDVCRRDTDPLHQIKTPMLTLDDPAMEMVMAESPMEARARRVRKSRTFNLNACICGSEVTQMEIEVGDTVMRCRVQGCETEWVCTNTLWFSSAY